MMPPEGASASLSMGDGFSAAIYGTPSVSPATRHGAMVIILGTLESGHELTLTITSLEYLDRGEDACRDAHATGIVQADMRAAS